MADEPFELSLAAQRALSMENPRVLAFAGHWRGGQWLSDVACKFDSHLVGMAAVGLVARNRPHHVALCIANIAARRTTSMIYCAQSPAGLASDIRALQLPVIVADECDWSDEALCAAREAGTMAISTRDTSADVAIEVLADVRGDEGNAGESNVALQLLSSGTTGSPKRIDLSWSSISSAVENAGAAYAGSDAAAPQIMVHPLGNVAGLAYAVPPLVFSRPLVLLDRFTPLGWAEAVRDYRPKRGTVPPVGIKMVLECEFPDDWLASLDLVAVGGGRVEPELQEAFERRFGVPVLTAYGATEFAGVIANWSLAEYREFGLRKRGSAGRASAGVTIRIVDEGSGHPLAPGKTGILEAKVARLGDGWVRTTDLASIDDDGFLFIHGRSDGAINRGGFKIVPDHVAGKLRTLEGVSDAAVVGIPDERLGEVPVAVVERERDATLSISGITRRLRDLLPAYQIPVEIRILDSLPRNASLKISLDEVRKLFG
ncbi:long-chain fatty acid--CoA ligase [Erythrobacter litoralis]|uniref:class I adenylate-forming enzyme family protein n=1 Tax=Erythrobacter litoralis TaxID=39960 RepID=UPI002434E964|nr:fatty acid--CoA ligase family protein [Erythrobacter litoralis]MDG6079876.1 long-chain fatty acid--CoA ligase [Erythrobacter litoralis]